MSHQVAQEQLNALQNQQRGPRLYRLVLKSQLPQTTVNLISELVNSKQYVDDFVGELTFFCMSHQVAQEQLNALQNQQRGPRPLHTGYPPPSTLNPRPSTLNPTPLTLHPQHSTLNPQPSTLNPQYSTSSDQRRPHHSTPTQTPRAPTPRTTGQP